MTSPPVDLALHPWLQQPQPRKWLDFSGGGVASWPAIRSRRYLLGLRRQTTTPQPLFLPPRPWLQQLSWFFRGTDSYSAIRPHRCRLDLTRQTRTSCPRFVSPSAWQTQTRSRAMGGRGGGEATHIIVHWGSCTHDKSYL